MDHILDDVLVDAGLVKCEECSQPMIYKGGGRYVCENCHRECLSDFGKIKLYLEEHGPSNAIELSEATGVPRREIMGFLREGRVEVASSSETILFCARCGTAIRFGTYCPECEKKVAAEKRGKGTLANLRSSESGKMRFEID